MTPKFSPDYKLDPEQATHLADLKLARLLEDPEIGPHIIGVIQGTRDPKLLFTVAWRMGYGMGLHDIEDGVLKMVKDN